MKKIYQSIILFIAVFSLAGIASCSKEDAANGGEPRIKYIRVTNPEAADSLLTAAGQGSLIAIVGENLGAAKEIWFNDQKAVLTPTYITDETILVSVPSKVPTEITNSMRIVFSGGRTLEHSVKLQISKPENKSMTSEYVLDGDVATIKGNYFYEPLSVTFPGGVTGELEAVKDDEIQVRVPAGAQPGQITIKTNFGETKSNFWFRDNRNIYISSDPFSGWWNESFVVTDPGPGDPPAINGNYIRVTKAIGSWSWIEVAGGPANAMGEISKNIPDEAILKPENYYLKFEVNTLKPYNANAIMLNVGLTGENNNGYAWMPPIDTQGKWQTITIPFDEVTKSYKTKLTVSKDGYWARVVFSGAGDLDCDMAFDNFRVVPKVIKD